MKLRGNRNHTHTREKKEYALYKRLAINDDSCLSRFSTTTHPPPKTDEKEKRKSNSTSRTTISSSSSSNNSTSRSKMSEEEISLLFDFMSEPELRKWLEANPHVVNARNMLGETCLSRAVNDLQSAHLVLWLVERGAELKAADHCGYFAIQYASSTELYDALLDSGADPTVLIEKGFTLLMADVIIRGYDLATHLLKIPRVHTVINAQDRFKNSALHFACQKLDDPAVPPLILLLLKCGANLNQEDVLGETPMRLLQRLYPSHLLTIRLADELLTVEKTDAIVIGVRKVMASGRPVAPCLRPACKLGWSAADPCRSWEWLGRRV